MPSKGIVVAEILDLARHPDAEHIIIAMVETGDRKPRQIVFGGRRMPRIGDLVAVAPPGSRLVGGIKMRRRRYRGQWSHGMLCSTTELGWADDGPDEIAVLRPGYDPGKSLDQVDFPHEWLDERSRKGLRDVHA